MKNTDTLPASPGCKEIFTTFLKLGLTSFGGPIAHIGYFRKELIERQQWLTESQFGQLLAISQFLPGPASSQLGFAIGLLRGGWLGALAAFLGFTLPSALILAGFASLLPALSGDIGTSVIHGLKLVACAVVADAVLGMFRKLCPDVQRRLIAVFAAGVLLTAHSAWIQILIVICSGMAGLVLCHRASDMFEVQLRVPYGKRIGCLLFIFFLILLFVLPLASNPQGGLTSTVYAFYRAGALVFGGGHVVLPLLEESIVNSGWLTETQFLAGYGAAQAIPGPMFAFSAYLGALIPSDYGSCPTAAAALLFMFLPGFLLISAMLPFWQIIVHRPWAASMISGVNAAVVGILAAALYDPIIVSSITSGYDIAVAAAGFIMLAGWQISPLYVVVWCLVSSVIPGIL